MSRYPRTCRNGHTIAGPDDEIANVSVSSRGRRPFRTCRVCRQLDRQRKNARRIANGKHADAVNRWNRARADAADAAAPSGKLRRIPRSGDETKTKPTDN